MLFCLTNQTKEKDDDDVAQTSQFSTPHPNYKLSYFISEIFHKISQLNKRSIIIIIIMFKEGVWYV